MCLHSRLYTITLDGRGPLTFKSQGELGRDGGCGELRPSCDLLVPPPRELSQTWQYQNICQPFHWCDVKVGVTDQVVAGVFVLWCKSLVNVDFFYIVITEKHTKVI